MDLMLDLETGNVTPDAAILSIGAVLFDPLSDELGESMLCAIPPEDNDTHGRTWSGSTIQFWTNNPQALAELGNQDQLSLRQAALKLHSLITRNKPTHIWAKSPAFDCRIIRHLYESIGLYLPVHWSRERCVRTIEMVLPKSLHPVREGTYHNALDDAKHQARTIQAFFQVCQVPAD